MASMYLQDGDLDLVNKIAGFYYRTYKRKTPEINRNTRQLLREIEACPCNTCAERTTCETECSPFNLYVNRKCYY
jgi:hypothetical protein